jgi:hypothetical protein
MATARDEPWYLLTRHFLDALFDLGFLADEAAESFKRMVLGICAAFFSFGLLLVRVFMGKYAYLGALDVPEPYRQAVLADHAFMIAIPMWIVALVAVLVGHSLFPDETDFRVLMALPVSRRLVFGSKLFALALFTGLFIVGTHVAIAPLFLVTSIGRWPAEPFVLRAASYAIATLLASGFAILAVTAIHGLLVLVAPRGRLIAASAAVRSALVCALVLSLPFLARLPSQGRSLAEGARWLFLAPPAWFVGVERWLLGDVHAQFAVLALWACLATAITLAVSVISYATLYRRFDRVILRAAEPRLGARERRRSRPLTRHDAPRPVYHAIRTFTATTLRRSVLHQGMVVALSAAAAGLVANALVTADIWRWWDDGRPPSIPLTAAVIWAPFVLMFVMTLAVRAALAVPFELRANWVFRMTEDDASRSDQLEAASHAVWYYGVVAPLAAMLPLQCLSLGSDAPVAAIITLLIGGIFAETLMRDWARIPFTCSFAPGKGFVPQTILIGVLSFIGFTTVGVAIVGLGLAAPAAAWLLTIFLLAAILLMRRRRLDYGKHTPLVFEDHLPTELNPLRLNVD